MNNLPNYSVLAYSLRYSLSNCPFCAVKVTVCSQVATDDGLSVTNEIQNQIFRDTFVSFLIKVSLHHHHHHHHLQGE